MILFTVLLLTLIMLMVISIIALSAGGAAVIIIFGDVFVCMFLDAEALRRKRRNLRNFGTAQARQARYEYCVRFLHYGCERRADCFFRLRHACHSRDLYAVEPLHRKPHRG